MLDEDGIQGWGLSWELEMSPWTKIVLEIGMDEAPA